MNKEHREPSPVSEPLRKSSQLTVIFKGLNKCNAGCTFCCVGNPKGKIVTWANFTRIADELERYLQQQDIKRLTFTFHGGEPTLLGADLIDKICRRVNQMPVTVSFNMQSNLIAVPASVWQVIRKYEIKIGTSVDPLGLDRVDKAGDDAFARWLTTYLDFAPQGRAPGAIYVITKTSLGQAQRIYDICESIGTLVGQRFGLQINPVYAQGRAFDRRKELTITPKELGEFLVDMWRIWEVNRRSISLTPIQNFADFFRRSEHNKTPHLSCAFTGDCSGHVGIDYDLNVAGCGRRLDSQAFMGNLRKDSLISILGNNHENHVISSRLRQLEKGLCSDCRFFRLCHGGCPDDAWLATKDINKPYHWCSSYRLLFESMENEISDYRQPPVPPPFLPKRDTEKMEILAIEEPEQIPEVVRNLTEIWLLPDVNGTWLRFDSTIPLPKWSGGRSQMRLWCYNRHVNSLVMWEDLLQTKGVAVVLFEAEGLETAMNILNSLRAVIVLDVLSIVRAIDGPKILKKVVKLFTEDPLWHSQVLPFSEMIAKMAKFETSSFKNSFGFGLGHFTIKVPKNRTLGNEESRTIITRLRIESEARPTDWVLNRRPCLSCLYFRICRAQFAPGDGNQCSNELLPIVAHVHETGHKLRSILLAQ